MRSNRKHENGILSDSSSGCYNLASKSVFSRKVTYLQRDSLSPRYALGVYDADWNFSKTVVEKFANTPIANSPDHIWNQTLALHNKGWYGALSAHGQGGQYLDNTGSRDRYIAGFTTLSAQLSYTFPLLSSAEATISLQANNLLNASYSPTGYVYDAGKIIGKDGKESYYADLRYFPQAGRHIMSTLKVTF